MAVVLCMVNILRAARIKYPAHKYVNFVMTFQCNKWLNPLKNVRCYRYCIWKQVQLKLSLRALWKCLGEDCEGNVPLILNLGRLFHVSSSLSPGMSFRCSLNGRLGTAHTRFGRAPLPAIEPLFLGFPAQPLHLLSYPS
jgi:hypothetical protein